ncbi:MAG: pyrroline-5-carboxylate reductase family protein [Candidatus Saccharicenans sp.]|uniref:pyrroline-5-carboxylate reductase family protein n=1 Tax=Candidatus Saccharicenans sp. TaxID=2819258 RepID=UPI00404A8BF2
MGYKKVGFIGGGRIVRIILSGWKRKNSLPAEIKSVEIKPEVAEKLKTMFPEVQLGNKVEDLAGSEIIFLAVHPPVMPEVLGELKKILKPKMVICSFVPKFSLNKLMEALGGFDRLIRINPLATSFVNAGFNPASFGPGLSVDDRNRFLSQMTVLGQVPEVKDELIEVYASVSAMGPSYLWFLFYELVRLGEEFGLTREQSLAAVSSMLIGAARTMAESGLSPEEVMDLIPACPFAEEEEKIKELYRQKITAIYQKLKT